MKTSSLFLSIMNAIKTSQDNDMTFSDMEDHLLKTLKKAVEKSFTDSSMSKQNDIYLSSSEIEDVLSNLLRQAEETSEKFQMLKNVKKGLSSLNKLVSEITEKEFYKLEKSLRNKIFNKMEELIDEDEFCTIVDEAEYNVYSTQYSNFCDIKDSYEEQKEQDFNTESSHYTIEDLKTVLQELKDFIS